MLIWYEIHFMLVCLVFTCFYLSLIAQTCPNLPKIAFTLFFHCLNKKMWLQKVLALLSLALVISLIQCTGVCWEVALEPIELPFILSGVYSPSEANYCSNPFEIFSTLFIYIKLLDVGDERSYKCEILALFFLHFVLIGWILSSIIF